MESTEHLSSKQVESYKRRTLVPGELLNVSRHLAECKMCRQLLSGDEGAASAFISLRNEFRSEALAQPTHLRYEQLAAYVDGALDEVEREISESHLEVCQSCSAEAQDMVDLKAELGRPPAAGAEGERNRWWRDLKAYWQKPAYRIPIQVAAAAALIVAGAWLTARPLRKQVDELNRELAEAQRKNGELQKEAESVAELRTRLDDLQRLQRLQPGPATDNSQTLNDGNRTVALDQEGNLGGIESVSPGISRAVKAAWVNDQAAISAEIKGLIGKRGTLAGGSGEGSPFALRGPVGIVVETDRPTFRWQTLAGVTAYSVTIFDSGSGEAADSGQLTAPKWTPARPLKRGETYSWQVTAVKGGKEFKSPEPPAPEARFKILDSSKAEELAQARKLYPNSHLILGSVYERAGMLAEAEREFKLLLAANPQSPVAQKLLRNLKSLPRK